MICKRLNYFTNVEWFILIWRIVCCYLNSFSFCNFQVLVLPILHLQTFSQAYMKTNINNEDIKTWAKTIHSTLVMKICKFYTSFCKITSRFTLSGA